MNNASQPNLTSSTGRANGAGGEVDMTALRIVIVDDDAMIGALLAEMLEAMGYEVCAIEGSEAAAVTAAARCNPDLMIVDVGLGEGSGVAAMDTIGRAAFVPHLFVTGDISAVKALKPGAVIMQKPFREAELTGAIQRALGAALTS